MAEKRISAKRVFLVKAHTSVILERDPATGESITEAQYPPGILVAGSDLPPIIDLGGLLSAGAWEELTGRSDAEQAAAQQAFMEPEAPALEGA